jgi:hypothetical protein
MAHKRQLQTTFISGELAAELALRVDTKQYANGAKRLLNRRCLIGGGTSRRPGTRRLNTIVDNIRPRLIEFVFNETQQYIISFQPGRADAYFPDGTYAGLVAGNHAAAPWNENHMMGMDFMQTANTIIVTHEAFPPVQITRLGTNVWDDQPYKFFTSGPRLEQPYFKVAPFNITMKPSAVEGTIGLTLSAPWFSSDHVGQRMRYLGREMLITSVGSSITAVATVLEKLPGTYDIGVLDGTGFTVGETVIGATTGAKGVISRITSNNTLSVYLRQANIVSSSGPGGATTPPEVLFVTGGVPLPGFSSPAQASLQPFQVDEVLVGPTFTSKITAISSTPEGGLAEVTDWDEALFTPRHGFPSCVTLHRNRLVFAGVPAVPNLLMASRLGNLFSFQVGDGSDSDAILATIGDSAAAEIRQVFSSDQLLIATDKGLYYCPEGPNQPFRPSSIAFIAFGSPWPISAACKMRAFDDGVIAVSGSTVIKARGTGDSQKTWNATEMSILSPHLLNEPYDMCVTTNFEGGPERYCIFSNIDGTLAVMMLVETQDIRNFVPWTSPGISSGALSYLGSACVVTKRVYIAVLRERWYLERFENELTLDGVMDLPNQAFLGNIPAFFPGGQVVDVVTFSGMALGPAPLKMDDIPNGPYHVGQNYPTIIETLPVALEDARGSSMGEMAKINEALVFTDKSCRFAGNGYEKQAYLVNEDANLPPPRRTGPQRLKFLGWRRDPTLTITQPDPLPLTVLAVKSEVCW